MLFVIVASEDFNIIISAVNPFILLFVFLLLIAVLTYPLLKNQIIIRFLGCLAMSISFCFAIAT